MDHLSQSLLSGFSLVAVGGLLADKGINFWKGRAERKANLARAAAELHGVEKTTVETEGARVQLTDELMASLTRAGSRFVALQNDINDLREKNVKLGDRVQELEHAAVERAQEEQLVREERDTLREECAHLRAELDENKREITTLRAEVARLQLLLAVATHVPEERASPA